MDNTLERSFTRSLLPWLAGVALLVVYLATLTTDVTLGSVMHWARATGADWHPVFNNPLTWLITYPVRWLPGGAQLPGLNFLSALLACFALVCLARTVALLPHDRTQLQRDKSINELGFIELKLAWVPVVFAVAACGLQMTFWENATVGTGEMLDLAIFAYCIRCLFEYRLEERQSWLYRLAFIYGAGITNNFALIALFPAMLAAILWLKKLRFFRFQFLLTMLLLGLAGLLFYLLLPLVQSRSEVADVSFWDALKTNLVYQKNYLMRFPRWRAGWIGIYALLPLVLASIKWPGGFGDLSALGSLFANIVAIVLHAGMLAFGLYMITDPPASPREFGLGLPFLPAYYLGALSIGYYSGFLILLFSPGPARSRRQFLMPPAVNFAVVGLVCAAMVATVGALLVRNYPKIRAQSSPALRHHAATLVASLPQKPSVLISDDPIRLYAVQALLQGRGQHLILDSGSLEKGAYHRFLQQKYGNEIVVKLSANGAGEIQPNAVLHLLTELAKRRELFYLHPSFGYYFEMFYPEPRGLLYALKPFPASASEMPVPSVGIIADQAAFWKAAQPVLDDLRARVSRLPEDILKRRESGDDATIADYYSRALNTWGTDLQRAGRLEEAVPFYELALALNPFNVVAAINKQGNLLWRNNRQRMSSLDKETESKLALYGGNFNALLGACGPIEEPVFANEFSRVLQQSGLYRQSLHMAMRALHYAPEDLSYHAAVAALHLGANQVEAAQQQLRAARALPAFATTEPPARIELNRLEASILMAQGRHADAERVLESNIRQFPAVDAGYSALAQYHVSQAAAIDATFAAPAARVHLTNAVRVLERQIQFQPKNLNAWFTHGNFSMNLRDYERAIASYDKVLETQKDNGAALMNRAIASLLAKKYDRARKDYETLLSKFTTSNFAIYYGLGEIAYQQQDWRAAREHYTDYLRYAPKESEEAKVIRARLEEVKKKL